MKHFPNHSTVLVRGLKLRLWHNESVKNHQQKSILFLHGMKDCSLSFLPLISHIRQAFRIYALDFRGHGQSEQLGHGASAHLLDYVKDAYIALHEIGKCDLLVGHSLGGNVALLLSALYSQKIKHTMLLDTLGPPSEGSEKIIHRLKNCMEFTTKPLNTKYFSSFSKAKEYLSSRQPNTHEQALEVLAKNIITKNDTGYYFNHDVNINGPTPFRFSNKAWHEIISAIDTQFFLALPANGAVLHTSTYKKRIEWFKNAHVRVFDNCSHQIHLEKANKLADWIGKIVANNTSF